MGLEIFNSDNKQVINPLDRRLRLIMRSALT